MMGSKRERQLKKWNKRLHPNRKRSKRELRIWAARNHHIFNRFNRLYYKAYGEYSPGVGNLVASHRAVRNALSKIKQITRAMENVSAGHEALGFGELKNAYQMLSEGFHVD